MLLRIHQHRIEQRIPAALANRKSKTTLTTAIANSRPTNVAYYPISSGTSVTRSKAGLFEFYATFYQLLICLSLMSLPQSAVFFFFLCKCLGFVAFLLIRQARRHTRTQTQTYQVNQAADKWARAGLRRNEMQMPQKYSHKINSSV